MGGRKYKKYKKLIQHDNNKDRFHEVPIRKAINNILSLMDISTHIKYTSMITQKTNVFQIN